MCSLPSDASTIRLDNVEPIAIEDFESMREELSWHGDAGRIFVADGQLHFQVAQPDQTIIRPFESVVEIGSVDLDFEVYSEACIEHSVGVVFWHSDISNYWYVEVGSNGYAVLARLMNGERRIVSRWTRIPALRKGSLNRLRVVFTHSEIIVYINGVRAIKEHNAPGGTGDIGAFAKTGSSAGLWVGIDRLEIRELETAITLDPRPFGARTQEVQSRIAWASFALASSLICSREEAWLGVIAGLLIVGYEVLLPSRHLIRVGKAASPEFVGGD